MMGSFVTRTLLLALGYAYPAYECFKTVERNKPEIEQLRFWCQYWILVVALTVFERVGDTFVSWLPVYSEAKLAFFIYLWYPKTRGTTFVYESFLRPYVTRHETEIDRNLLELKTKARDIVVLYWQKAAAYGQTRIFEILQFIASQSQSQPSRPQRNQQQQQNQQQQGHQTPPPIPAQQPDVAQKQAQPPFPNQPSSPVKSHTCEPAQKPVTAAQAGLATQVQATTSSSSVSIAEVPDSVVPSNSGRNWFFWRVTGEESRDVKDQHED